MSRHPSGRPTLIFMKHLLLAGILFLTVPLPGRPQAVAFPVFLKTFERNFSDPFLREDSCFNNATMIRVELDSAYKIRSISLADNAEPWQRKALERIQPRLAIGELEAYATAHQVKNAAFLFPLFLRKHGTACIGDTMMIPLDPRLFSFGGKSSRGFLMDKIELILMN